MRAQPAIRQIRLLASGALLLLALAVLSVPATAQTTVTGRVLNENGTPVPSAIIQLLLRSDSSLAKGALADLRGNFVLEGIPAGSYQILVSHIGYRSYSSDVIALGEARRLEVGPFVLQADAIELEGVSVRADKPLYQQRGDRLIINVESSPTLSGASALQVLERSPGVVVDRTSNSISMIGKSGVRVLINGKLSYLPAEALLQYLSGVSADNLEQIELITSPPASLDAEGNAGYVNLVMKRSPDDGLNGSATLSGGYGKGELGSASAGLNYRQGPTSIFGSYSFLWDARDQTFTNYRSITGTEGVTEMPAASWRDRVQRNHNARIGLDYQVNTRTTLGALVAGFDNRWSMTALNQLTIKTDGIPLTYIDSDNDEVNHWRHWMGNLNLQHKLGTAGMLQVDLDYLRYSNNNPTTYLNTSTDVGSGQVTSEEIESGKLTPLRILVARADYSLTQGRWELGAGVKGALSRFTNLISLEAPEEREWASEVGFGSESWLREDVLAAYGSASYAPGEATTLQIGLRYEWTDSNLGSETQPDIVDRQFGSLFPSVAVSHKLSDQHQLDASYARRITRPSFSDMAPFLYFFDPQTFFSGNAGLQSAITNTLKLDGTYGSVLASLQYAWEDSTIARFQNRFIPEHNIHVIFPTNFRGTRTATGLLAAPLRIAPWWSTQNNAMLIWQEVNGVSNSVPVTLTSTSYRLNSTQNISLPQDFAFEASGFYQSASLFGAIRFGSMWQVNVGLQKAFGNGGKLTLAVDDLFDAYNWRWTTGTPGDPLYIDTVLEFNRRTFKLTYSAGFGSGTAASKRSTASEDERGRVQ